jgi:probable F420-dependent oxidoreductase
MTSPPLRIGVHLPQYGRVASPEAITRAAQHAEALGFDDVWVSDHTVHPAAQSYPSPYLYEPLGTLTWAAAVTDRVGLGTSVLVVPTHEPVALANRLATLDNLSGGRLIIGAGVGWSADEYAALGHDFSTRGRRLDEAVDLMRAAWSDDPVDFAGEFSTLDAVRILPKPAGHIPIWFGGGSEAAYRRGVEKGDGFQIIGVKPDEARPIIARLREGRPEPDFTISLRTGWDPQGMDPAVIEEERHAFADAGVQQVVCAPWRDDLDDWLRSMDLLADLVVDR